MTIGNWPSAIPLALVTGFLGSGKTTLLRRLAARAEEGRPLLFLVNEFSATDVDGVRLREAGLEAVTIAGGSVFCRCLVTEFVGHLREIAGRWGRRAFAGVVVEASGMADPRVVGTMLAETGLDALFRLHSVTAVLDPVRFLKLLHTLPAIRSQIEAADVVMLNKTDLYAPEQVEVAANAARGINPLARLARTSYCETPVDLFPAAPSPHGRSGEFAKCRDPNFRTLSVPLPGPVDLERLRTAVTAAGDDLYRLKGYAEIDGRLARVDFAGSEVDVQPAADIGQPRELVAIMRGDSQDRVASLIRRV